MTCVLLDHISHTNSVTHPSDLVQPRQQTCLGWVWATLATLGSIALLANIVWARGGPSVASLTWIMASYGKWSRCQLLM